MELTRYCSKCGAEMIVTVEDWEYIQTTGEKFDARTQYRCPHRRHPFDGHDKYVLVDDRSKRAVWVDTL